MANISLSVIIPSKNNKYHVSDIIKRIAAELPEEEVEFIVIDMNSSDNSVIWALEEIKNNNLRGCVIQSGGGSISSALNTGIYKSDGKYITFVYPSRMYKDYLAEYLRTAEKTAAEFVFAVPSQTSGTASDSDFFRKKDNGCIDPAELMTELIYSRVFFDFTAVMLKREYLLRHHIKFYEDCHYGYVEAFIYNVLLHHPQTACADIRLERHTEGAAVKDTGTENVNCYERIDAMLKVYDALKLQRRENLKLLELFEYQKLPSVVIGVVDLLKKQGFSSQAIQKSLKQKGYSRLLQVSRCTTPALRKKVLRCRFLPWLYR